LQRVFQRKPLERWQWRLFLVAGLLMAIQVLEAFRNTDPLAALREIANSSAYIPLVLVAGIYFPTAENLKGFIKFLLVIYIPVGLYAIWQQIFGLSNFEVEYLKTGYTLTFRELDDVRPRPFSTLNSPHALSVVTATLAALAFFLRFKGSKRAAWQIPMGTLFTLACFASMRRTGWVLLAVAMIGRICFRRAWSTIGYYGLTIGLLVLLIANADRLADSLNYLQHETPADSALSEQAFRIGTFSDRLSSFRNLVDNPRYRTWFGDPKLRELEKDSWQVYRAIAHDQLTEVLVQFGFVGLGGFLILATGGLWLTHRTVLAQRDLEIRETAIALLSVLSAHLSCGMVFGGHLGIFPANIFFAFLVGGLVVCCVQRRETAAHPS
jgi:hypothetical protein